MKRAFLAMLILVFGAGVAQAAEIAINSSNGTTSWEALVDLTYGSFSAPLGTTGTAVVIDPHSAWNQTPPAWISYAQTGPNGTTLAPTYNTPIAATDPADQRQAIVSFTRVFTAAAGSTLDMKLWADDTAFMRLDGGPWVPAIHVWGQSTCETNPTSCQPSAFSEHVFTLTSSGDHTLEIWAYQIGTGTTLPDGTFYGTNATNPFGIQYDGVLSTVPDGGTTLMLLGGALVGLGALRRKFRA